MQKSYIYIILIIVIFLSGLFIGRGSTSGEINRITGNLQSAENRVSELTDAISGYQKTITELERIKSEQDRFIDKIKEGFDNSRKSVDRIESGAYRGSEIIESILKEIDS